MRAFLISRVKEIIDMPPQEKFKEQFSFYWRHNHEVFVNRCKGKIIQQTLKNQEVRSDRRKTLPFCDFRLQVSTSAG